MTLHGIHFRTYYILLIHYDDVDDDVNQTVLFQPTITIYNRTTTVKCPPPPEIICMVELSNFAVKKISYSF